MVTERSFGTLPSGEEVKCFHLENASGAYAEVLSSQRSACLTVKGT